MIRRPLMILAALLVLSVSSVAGAQEIMLEGPLAGAPACSNCVLHREGRFTVAPIFSFTLLDDYRRHIFIGGRIQYNFTDWLGIGIAGGASGFWGDALDTGLTEQVSLKAPNGIESNRANYPFTANSEGNSAAESLTTELLGRILGFVSLELYFTPFRGKLGLFSRLFLDVDMYIFAGYAIPFVEERADVDCRSWNDFNREGARAPSGVSDEASAETYRDEQCPWNTVDRAESRVAVGAGTYGLGISIYANNFVSLFLEYRLMPFFWNHTGTDERGTQLVGSELTLCPSDAAEGDSDYCGDTGEFPDRRINSDDRTWTVNHMVSFGAVFHFPTTPRRTE